MDNYLILILIVAIVATLFYFREKIFSYIMPDITKPDNDAKFSDKQKNKKSNKKKDGTKYEDKGDSIKNYDSDDETFYNETEEQSEFGETDFDNISLLSGISENKDNDSEFSENKSSGSLSISSKLSGKSLESGDSNYSFASSNRGDGNSKLSFMD